jgi:hypothetical protein
MWFQSKAYLNYVVALGIRVNFNGTKNPIIYDNDYGMTTFMSTWSTKCLWNDYILVTLNPKMTLELLDFCTRGTENE